MRPFAAWRVDNPQCLQQPQAHAALGPLDILLDQGSCQVLNDLPGMLSRSAPSQCFNLSRLSLHTWTTSLTTLTKLRWSLRNVSRALQIQLPCQRNLQD